VAADGPIVAIAVAGPSIVPDTRAIASADARFAREAGARTDVAELLVTAPERSWALSRSLRADEDDFIDTLGLGSPVACWVELPQTGQSEDHVAGVEAGPQCPS
jgi:hypothetical protein